MPIFGHPALYSSSFTKINELLKLEEHSQKLKSTSTIYIKHFSCAFDKVHSCIFKVKGHSQKLKYTSAIYIANPLITHFSCAFPELH